LGSATYRFINPYIVPWNTTCYVRVTANLGCQVALSKNIDEKEECVDTRDLYIVNIDNPSSAKDNIGSSIQVRATIGNHSNLIPFAGLNITFVVTNSQGIQEDKFTEITSAIGTSATVSHTFSRSYTVPNDSVYYLTVYIENNDIYLNNDTITIRRETTNVGINSTGNVNIFTLAQNIPNPANNSTRIDYSVPESGEVIFHVYSISGQLLYSKTAETERGTHSIELNTARFTAGVYFYSMEYKGQRLVKQLIISN
jgi:hypothetical protein